MRRDVSDFAVQAFCVVPVHPFQGFPFDLADGFSRPHEVDDLSFEQADCAFGQGIVVAVADAAHRRIDIRFGQPLGVDIAIRGPNGAPGPLKELAGI